MIKFASLAVGAILVSFLILPAQTRAGTLRNLHIDLSYPGTAASYNLYKNGQLVCSSPAQPSLSMDCAVELDRVPMAFTLTAVDSSGVESHESSPYILEPPPLTAAFSANPPSSPSSTTFGFDASPSSVTDGIILQYAWEFGDGATGTGEFIDHTYAASGTYTVRLTVTDDANHYAVAENSIFVPPPSYPPRVRGKKIVIKEDRATNVTLTATSESGAPLTYSLATPPEHGTITRLNPRTGTLSYTPRKDFSGTDRFTFVATSNGMRSSPAPVAITVLEVNDPPKAVTDDVSTGITRSVAIPVLANDSDPENDPLRVVAISRPSAGTARLVNSVVVYTAPARTGVFSLSYTITDAKGAKATGRVIVTVGR